MPGSDAIIRIRRDRLLSAKLTGCDVNFCWMTVIQKFDESSAPPLAFTNQCGSSQGWFKCPTFTQPLDKFFWFKNALLENCRAFVDGQESLKALEFFQKCLFWIDNYCPNPQQRLPREPNVLQDKSS